MKCKISGVVRKVISDTLLEVEVSEKSSSISEECFNLGSVKNVRLKINQSMFEIQNAVEKAAFLLDREVTCDIKEKDERGCLVVESYHF